MRIKLTDQAINKATREAEADGKRHELADAGCPGLHLRVTPAGARTWVLCARDTLGRACRFPLGRYPDLGIAEARAAARTTWQKVKHDGADPIAEARHKRAIGEAAKGGVGTLKALLETYGQATGVAPKSWKAGRPRIEVVFRPLLERPLPTLTLTDMQLQADSYPSAASRSFAVRTLRPVLKWASHPGRAYVSPELTHLSGPANNKPRDRVLSPQELRQLLPCLRKSRRPHASLMRFLLLTLARRQEAVRAVWADVNMEERTWTIPQTKNDQPHVVPLSNQSVELLKGIAQQQTEPFIFPTHKGTALGNWDRETKALKKASGTDGWNRHDLRRTGATMLGEMGETPDIIEAALNHVAIRSPLAATYNRSRYRPQVAAALQRLADKLDQLDVVPENKAENDVVPDSGGGLSRQPSPES